MSLDMLWEMNTGLGVVLCVYSKYLYAYKIDGTNVGSHKNTNINMS